MDHSQTMKNHIDHFLKLVKSDNAPFLIPARKGLRKMIPNHVFHDHAEVFLQIEGKTHFLFPTESLYLSAGDILIVPPELPHAEEVIRSQGLFETVVITPMESSLQCHISKDSKRGVPTILYYDLIMSKETLSIRQYTDMLIERGTPSDHSGVLISSGLITALLATVKSLLSHCEETPVENSKVTGVKNAVISQYHHYTLTVGQLAEQLSCTADYLSWLFHRETGITLNRYINQFRLKKAADFLKNTDYTISEIAWICGFKNPSYFSRVFSKEYSMSPREYR